MKLNKHRMLTVATDRAERFRPILDEFAALPAAAAAAALNGRNVPSPRGGRWYAAQVIRMRKRLATGPRRKTRKGLLDLQDGPPEMDFGGGEGRMPAETAMAESRAAAAVPRPRRRLAVGHLP
jgi:hypothetical protein